jgi:hypothetical protein
VDKIQSYLKAYHTDNITYALRDLMYKDWYYEVLVRHWLHSTPPAVPFSCSVQTPLFYPSSNPHLLSTPSSVHWILYMVPLLSCQSTNDVFWFQFHHKINNKQTKKILGDVDTRQHLVPACQSVLCFPQLHRVASRLQRRPAGHPSSVERE